MQFNKLVASHPMQKEPLTKDMDDFRAKNDGEMKLAESKVHAMLESKTSMVEGALAQLLKLRTDTSNIESELDETMKNILLQPMTNNIESDVYRAMMAKGGSRGHLQPKDWKDRIRQSISRTISKL